MAKVLTTVDDINGEHGAQERWALLYDGKKVHLIQIDLIDRNYGTLEERFKTAMSKYAVVGQVSTMKMGDLARLISKTLNPDGEPEPAAEPAAVKEKAAPKKTPAKKARPRHDSPSRPGITAWHRRNWQALGLPQPSGLRTGGRAPNAVVEAYTRYNGQDPTPEQLHPIDVERLTKG